MSMSERLEVAKLAASTSGTLTLFCAPEFAEAAKTAGIRATVCTEEQLGMLLFTKQPNKQNLLTEPKPVYLGDKVRVHGFLLCSLDPAGRIPKSYHGTDGTDPICLSLATIQQIASWCRGG